MRIYFAILLVGGLLSCQNSNKNINDNSSPQADTTAPVAKSNLVEQKDSIVLDNGKKWKVVPEMMIYIKKIEGDIIAFEKTKQVAGIKNYSELATKVQKNIDLLTSKCTMEGPAHDELHKWLLPFMQDVEHLGEAKNKEEALWIFNQINDSFKVLNLNFE
jgi:hypothetical protein